MPFPIKINEIYKYFKLILAFTVLLWLTSIFELIISNTTNTNFLTGISIKLVNDFWTGFIIGLVIFPIYFIINILSKKGALIVIKVILAILVIIQFALVKYSITTLLNLGADLLGYSFSDIYSTVSASETFSILYFLPFIIFPTLFIWLCSIINKHMNNRILLGSGVLIVLILGSLKLVITNSSDARFQNKIAYLTQDIIKFENEKRQLNISGLLNKNDFPLLKPFGYSKDVLSPFFNTKAEKPNIVVLIVEGLGSEFIGNNAYAGFTPYLDGLINKSLYWENFLSTSGRTFGVIPSLLGSLPLGESGFLELPKTPSHVSLISILKANGYKTSYFSGDQSTFDKKINFLEYNDIDNIIDENSYGPEYVKTNTNSEGFSWGYPDEEIFKKTLTTIEGIKEPRLDVIMTLSNHEPFNFPNKTFYETKVDSILNSNRTFNIPKEDIIANKDIYTSLYYTDNSIKKFMTDYAERADYNNTIFIITGDHRLIPIVQKDKLCRFHVPLYIYSPMLKQAKTFKSVSSHWDVTPSLLSFLSANYKFNHIGKMAWMGEGLDTTKHYRNIHKIPLMRYKGSINDFMYRDYFYSDGELYRVNENFGTYKVKEDIILKTMADSLMAFKRLNAYVTKHNKIYPDSLNIYVKPNIDFSDKQLAVISKLTKGLNYDQTFEVAKQKAFKKDETTARLLCNYILNALPNHADARTLKARTFAWNGEFNKAEIELKNVIKRTPFYNDSYLALLDLYWWSKHEEKSETIYLDALKNNIKIPTLGFKMAHAYMRLKNTNRANTVIDSLLEKYPENPEYLTFKKQLEEKPSQYE